MIKHLINFLNSFDATTEYGKISDKRMFELHFAQKHLVLVTLNTFEKVLMACGNKYSNESTSSPAEFQLLTEFMTKTFSLIDNI